MLSNLQRTIVKPINFRFLSESLKEGTTNDCRNIVFTISKPNLYNTKQYFNYCIGDARSITVKNKQKIIDSYNYVGELIFGACVLTGFVGGAKTYYNTIKVDKDHKCRYNWSDDCHGKHNMNFGLLLLTGTGGAIGGALAGVLIAGYWPIAVPATLIASTAALTNYDTKKRKFKFGF